MYTYQAGPVIVSVDGEENLTWDILGDDAEPITRVIGPETEAESLVGLLNRQPVG
jgi:hypothetical protein